MGSGEPVSDAADPDDPYWELARMYKFNAARRATETPRGGRKPRPDDEGGASVREPRVPVPSQPSASAEADLPCPTTT